MITVRRGNFGFRTIYKNDEHGRLCEAYSEDDYVECYDLAMAYKKSGLLDKAVELLENSTNPPTIYHGHYGELFIIYQIFNKRDMQHHCYEQVIERITKMLRLNQEMLNAMIKHHRQVHSMQIPDDYFDGYSKIKITDLKTLLKASTMIGDDKTFQTANYLIQNFKR